jgi:HEAT repeat protein
MSLVVHAGTEELGEELGDTSTIKKVEGIIEAIFESSALGIGEHAVSARLAATGALGKLASANISTGHARIAKQALLGLDDALAMFSLSIVDKMGAPDPAIRLISCETLGRLGMAAAPHHAAVASHIRDKDGLVRAAACAALGQFGAAACVHAELLAGRLEDSLYEVRLGACQSLGNILFLFWPKKKCLLITLVGFRLFKRARKAC